MKNETSISAQFGVTQQEMAMLLGVSRSLWSLYELGKRDLPLSATLLLNDLMTKTRDHQSIKKSEPATTSTHMLLRFERLLQENGYQLHIINRKIAALGKKQTTQLNLQQLSGLLQGREHSRSSATVSDAVTARASIAAKTCLSDELAVQQHRREVLAFEKQLLESKLEALRQDAEK